MDIKNLFRVGELVEEIKRINYLLERDFGKHYDGRPTWRVVWSDDQLEKRLCDFTDEGFQLINPEVREVRKYSYIRERYVLERLVEVAGQTDIVTPYSYEPAWTFEDRFHNYLPPRFDACKVIIETIYDNMARKGIKKYVDEENTPEARQKKILDMEEKLFGNETPTGDALAHGYGVVNAGEATRKEM